MTSSGQPDRFVALYMYYSEDFSTHQYAMRIGTVTGSIMTFGGEIEVTDLVDAGFSESSVVALQDGGFFVAWSDEGGDLRGTRYDSSGNVFGAQGFLIAAATQGDLGQLSLTLDGRILITFKDASGEISQIILDPRENTIAGDDANNV